MGSRIGTAVLAACALVAGACQGPPRAEAALSPVEQLAADSSAGDSAAFATLPEPLLEFLDIRTELAALPGERIRCAILPPQRTSEERRRLRIRFDDQSSALLYAVSDEASGSIHRVEYIRRVPGQGQRGLIWDGERDRTTSTWWTETAWGLSRRVERGEMPRGGPLPRALRGLGRQLLLLPCEAEADSSAGPHP